MYFWGLVGSLVLSLCLSSVFGLYDSSDEVVELTQANFNSRVIGSDELWLVEFYAPWCGHCQSLAPEWKKAASALKGVVKIGAVDMDQHQSVGQPYNIRGFPTIKIFGANKNSPQDYQGQRTADGIVSAAMSHLQSLVQSRLSGSSGQRQHRQSSGSGSDSDSSDGSVIELTASNFEKTVYNSDQLVLVAFVAPWCGHCKNLKPQWSDAAKQLAGKVKVAQVDATAHESLAQMFSVQGFPTIKAFPAGASGPNDAIEYDGGRDSESIVRWANDKSVESLPDPEITELTTPDIMKSACEDHQLCAVVALPQLLDCQSACRNKYLATMKAAAAKFKRLRWGWIWLEGAGNQQAVEEAFGMGGFGYPALVVLNSKKLKFSMLKGPFTEAGINEFLSGLSLGRGSTEPVRGAAMPTVKKRAPWDGKDAKLETEEEIDLSELGITPKTEL